MVRHHVKKKKRKQGDASKGDGEKERSIRDKLSHLDQFAGSSSEEDDEEVVGNQAPRKDDEEEAASAAAREVGIEGGAHRGDDAMRRPSPRSTEEKNGDELRDRRARKGLEDRGGDDDEDSDADDDEDGRSHDDHSDGDDGHDDDDGYEVHDDDEADDDEGEHVGRARGTLGMANAMARILGTTAESSASAAASVADAADGRTGFAERPDHGRKKDRAGKGTGTGAVVLSRTTTKLQRMAAEEREAASELRRKRRDRRRENLVGMHVPLSKTDAGAGAAREIEEERAHRRIATRGVVALFNAIASHQRQKRELEEVGGDRGGRQGEAEGSGEQQQSLTKRKFLEMIKESSTSKTAANAVGVDREQRKESPKKKSDSGAHSVSSTARKESGGSKIGWKALQEDYMMGSNRLKDWDKEDSDESSDGDNA